MRSTTEWQFWGRHDPMWAVRTSKGRERDGPNPWTVDEFRASGRSDCADIMHHWNHYGRIRGGVCIEIGCGCGRLTSPLLSHFDRVLGIDVSPDQIALARRILGNETARVDFRIVTSPAIDAPPGSCSAMISTFVFQHLSDYSGIVSYLREAYRALAPGASVCFQIPVPGAETGDIPSPRDRVVKFVGTHLRRAFGLYRFMEYNRYPASRIVSTLQAIGFVDVEVRIFRLTGRNVRYSFFFARKPA